MVGKLMEGMIEVAIACSVWKVGAGVLYAWILFVKLASSWLGGANLDKSSTERDQVLRDMAARLAPPDEEGHPAALPSEDGSWFVRGSVKSWNDLQECISQVVDTADVR